MSDMLVKLYEVEERPELYEALKEKGISVRRALGLDASRILKFIEENFDKNWVDECRVALVKQPSTCYIAVKDKKLIGFCCYDATYIDFLGPLGVAESERGQGIGQALLRRCMLAMGEAGYGYAIIGWAAPKAIPMYERCFGATLIPGSHPGIYRAMIEMEESV